MKESMLFQLSLLTNDTNIPLIIGLVSGGVVLIVTMILLLYFFVFKKKNKKSIDNNAWFVALGEKDNIKEVKGIGSRLTVVLLDQTKADKEQLKALGVSNIIAMSNKMTLVIEGEAERIANLLNNSL